MLTYAAERGGNVDDPNKRDPLDFVLWQPSAADEPAWETMWGPGRPGWHIECSALALRELGTTIDLHGGGADLIFPHHESERAQSEAATGEPFVRHWMHVAMVRMDGEKMSKSLGNLVFVDALRREQDPRAIRLAIIEHHYRDSWEWDDTSCPGPTHASRGGWPPRAPAGERRARPSTRCGPHSTTTSTRPERWPPSTRPSIGASRSADAAGLLGVDLSAPAELPERERPADRMDQDLWVYPGPVLTPNLSGSDRPGEQG